MTRFIAALCGLGLVAVLTAAPARAAEDAEDFLKQAIRGNIAEIQMGELAQKQGKNPRVQEFGKTLSSDHAKAKAKAVELAKEMNVDPPTKPTEEAKEAYDRLAKLSGDKFDREFVGVAIKDHKKDIEAYSEQAKSGDNKKVGEYAEETLPVLKKHLDMAQKLESNVER